MSKRLRGPLLVSVVLTGALTVTVATADRARDLGIEPSVFPPGPLNAIMYGECALERRSKEYTALLGSD